jgi:hypothetical protein
MEEKSRTMKYIDELFREAEAPCLKLIGKCQKCKCEVDLTVWRKPFDIEGNGGIVKGVDEMPEFKCSECLEKDKGMISPQRTEVFSRVVGYLRPVSNYNPGKTAEREMRTNFNMGNLDLTQRIDMTEHLAKIEKEVEEMVNKELNGLKGGV